MAEIAAKILESIPQITRCQWSCNDTLLRIPIENPATGKIITTLQAGNEETVNLAVQASQEAFESWQWKPRFERSAYLFRAADELDKHAEELAALLCLENGKPYKDALSFDVKFLTAVFRYFASIGDKLPSELFDQGSVYSAVIYEPRGVCVGILPFNWPPIHCGGKLAPCLAAGNTMILKPGDQAPLTVLRIAEILQTVFPENVVQVVAGSGAEVPQALIRHPLVKMVSLTGSTNSGSLAAQTAAETITPTVLELGGKNALVIFEDADLDQAVRDALEGAFFNKGESCTSSSRILVHDSIYPTFCARFSAVVRKLSTGDGFDPSTHIGPVVSKERQEEVLEWIKIGKQEGATLAAQGPLPTSGHTSKGFFVPPTLFIDVKPDMRIAQDEIFGPVTAVISFSTEDEAVRIVNSSRYGLFAGIYSADNARAMRVARRVDVGCVIINNFFRGLLGTPFGGTKESGYGREHWIGTLREWSHIKNIRIPTGLGQIPTWTGVSDLFNT